MARSKVNFQFNLDGWVGWLRAACGRGTYLNDYRKHRCLQISRFDIIMMELLYIIIYIYHYIKKHWHSYDFMSKTIQRSQSQWMNQWWRLSRDVFLSSLHHAALPTASSLWISMDLIQTFSCPPPPVRPDAVAGPAHSSRGLKYPILTFPSKSCPPSQRQLTLLTPLKTWNIVVLGYTYSLNVTKLNHLFHVLLAQLGVG